MKKKKKKIFLVVLLIIVMIFVISIPTIAKYVYNSVLDYYFESKGFYFTSDHLDTTLLNNVNNLWNGESIHFNIKNNLNDSVITEYDINYDITCTIKGEAANHTKCTLNGTDSNKYSGNLSKLESCVNDTSDGVDVSLFDNATCEVSGYKWENKASIKDNYFDISLTDESYKLTDIIVNISVSSSSPYKKNLIGDFVLHKVNNIINDIEYSYKNYDNYGVLILSNNSLSDKCFNISWNPNNLKTSLNNDNVTEYFDDENQNINRIKTTVYLNSSNSYIFYKQNLDINYNKEEFTIEELNDC